MQPRLSNICSNLLKASAILILMISVLGWGERAAWALSYPGLSSSNVPSIYLADTGVDISLVDQSSGLETTLDQFLKGIPRGYYGLRDIDQLKTRLKETDLVVIDVREPSEYAAGRIDGAINIPLRALVQNLDQVPKDKPVMLYCSSGYRTGMGVMTLQLLGYGNVEGFPPSYNGWTKAQ